MQDLDQKPRIVLTGFGFDSALLLEHAPQRERYSRDNRQGLAHSRILARGGSLVTNGHVPECPQLNEGLLPRLRRRR